MQADEERPHQACGRLVGKVALVLGGANGIGRAISELFSTENATVVVADLDRVAGQRLTGRVTSAGGRARFMTTDVRHTDEVNAVVDEAVAAYGRLDTVVHSVFDQEKALVTELPEASWARVVDIGLTSAYRLTAAALPALMAAAPSSITFISSIHAKLGISGAPAYAAAKAGLEGLTRQLAVDYGPHGVRVNSVQPGLTLTERTRAAWADEKLAQQVARYPLQRAGTPQDVANAALFLASDESAFITGASLPVDGGFSIRSAGIADGNENTTGE